MKISNLLKADFKTFRVLPRSTQTPKVRKSFSSPRLFPPRNSQSLFPHEKVSDRFSSPERKEARPRDRRPERSDRWLHYHKYAFQDLSLSLGMLTYLFCAGWARLEKVQS